MSYRAGDYLAVLPHNPIGVVMRALKRFDLASDSQIVIRKPDEQHHLAAGRLPGQRRASCCSTTSSWRSRRRAAQVAALAAATRCPPEQAELERAGRGGRLPARRARQARQRARPARALSRSCELGLAAFLEMLPPVRARQYSISSSPLWNARRCTLTVAVVDAPALSGQRPLPGHGVDRTSPTARRARASRWRCARRTTTSIRRPRPRRRW